MTPEQRALAAAFLAECWPTVRQYNAGDGPPKRRRAPREPCPICGAEVASSYLRNHVIRRHPETVESVVDSGESGAA